MTNIPLDKLSCKLETFEMFGSKPFWPQMCELRACQIGVINLSFFTQFGVLSSAADKAEYFAHKDSSNSTL